MKHPYFTTPPLPARPGEIPHFQDSHELDRKKFRGQRAPLPPAPAGGSGDAPSHGSWASSGSRGMVNNRIPGAVRIGRSSISGIPGSRRGPLPSSQRDNGLPPRPPVSAQPPWDGSQIGRVEGREDQRRERFNQVHSGGRYPTNVDSYVPSYGNSYEGSRDLNDCNSQPNVDWRGTHRRESSTRRSRSPSLRDSSRR